ncbi:hypothetical protein QJS10_CPA02g00924 [Acorus calamus]|uniref:CCHC-type domain-containing protein n=1 Tax=Acorus calamus TaxID=4465 RepID=A0AAV9FGG0_ACOCL|nr:hypothetical protein QJS10_CPA02g00924 [Acorus calamus]
MRQIEQVSKEAHSYLMTEKDHCWSRSMFGTSAKCSHLTNNISESFNAFIGDARAKPIIYCIDAIRLKNMVNMNKRRLLAEKWTGVLVPEVQKIVTELSKNKGMYKRAYGMAIAPLPDKSMWEIEDLNYVVKPPVQTRPPPGRPRKKRIRPTDEGSSQSKVRRIHVCRRCGGYGHLQRTCKNPPKPQSSEDPSSEASSSMRRPPGRPRKPEGIGRGRGRGTGRAVQGCEVQAAASYKPAAGEPFFSIHWAANGKGKQVNEMREES